MITDAADVGPPLTDGVHDAESGKSAVINGRLSVCGSTWNEIKEYALEVIPIIRENDPKSIIVVGTPQWSSLGLSGGDDTPKSIVESQLEFENGFLITPDISPTAKCKATFECEGGMVVDTFCHTENDGTGSLECRCRSGGELLR